MNMKFLLDSEILDWNKRLINLAYMVKPRYGTKNSYPMIGFSYISQVDQQIIETPEPSLKFQYSFSVAKNRTDLFWNIFNRWYETKIGNQVCFQDKHNADKINDIQVTEKIINEKTETTHSILTKEYTKYTYHFYGKLSSIMAYVMYLEDAINIFSQLYGYSEDGQEVNLTKFQIGSIVSKTGDKSKDYLVVELRPRKIDRKFYIDYIISEILSSGDIIKYGESETVSENQICFSRNSRIDDILDN